VFRKRKKEREEKRERRNEIMAAAPLLHLSEASHTRPISVSCEVNVGTVGSPALGGGYGVGRWPAHAR